MKAVLSIIRTCAKARLCALPVAAALLLHAPTIFGQTAPNLGVTSTFAVYTAVGRLDNSGATTVIGDLGTGTTPVTGFGGVPAGTVTGGAVYVGANGDAYATQAATDVAVAYGQMSAIPCVDNTLTVLGGTGNNPQVLTPNVYCLGTGAPLTLAGEVILDAQNNPNAQFFFKLYGALTTADLSRVTLINGASVRNVYWQVDGALTLGDNSFFRGTLLTSGAIHFHAGATLYGRALTTAGAIDMNTNNVALQDPAAAVLPLPVTLVNFSAVRQAPHTVVQWSTASEKNSKTFQVERSGTGLGNWTLVATVPAAGTSTSPRQYRALDEQTGTGLQYYRLRSTDLDGTFVFSSLRTVAFEGSAAPLATLFPNPVLGQLTVTGIAPGSTVTLVDLTGKMRQQQVAGDSGTERVETAQLVAGSYLLRVVSTAGVATALKVQKQ